MTTYEEFLQRRLPRWLRGTVIDRITSVVGGILDAGALGAYEATVAGLLELCPDDAVPYLAAMRLLDPLPGETPTALRARGLAAWDFWSTLGPIAGLQAYLRLVAGTDQLFLISQADANWQVGALPDDDDSNADNASRHVIIIDAPNPWARDLVGPGLIVGPELLVGIDMTATELSRIRGAYAKHRPANMVGIDLYVSFDPARDHEDTISDHSDPADQVKIPLHVMMVGYSHHGAVVGPSMIVGKVFV